MGRKSFAPQRARVKLVEKQGGKCFYCGQEFGQIIRYRGKCKVLASQLEHFIPYKHCSEHKRENFVASCQFCNAIKGTKLFDSEEDVFLFILERWKERGDERCLKNIEKYVRNVIRHLKPIALGQDSAKPSVETDGMPNKPNKPLVPNVDTLSEIWKTIPSFPKYEISSFGRIRRSIKSSFISVQTFPGRIKKPIIGSDGELFMIFRKNGKPILVQIQDLFYEVFLEEGLEYTPDSALNLL